MSIQSGKWFREDSGEMMAESGAGITELVHMLVDDQHRRDEEDARKAEQAAMECGHREVGHQQQLK